MPLKVESVKDRYAHASPRLKMLIAGPPGAGKTLFASTFPNVIYADAEGRLLSVRNRNVHAITITATSKLDELRAALAQSPDVREKVLGVPVDTVVLDTVDEIARLIIKERLRAEKRETMAMADWGYLGDTLRALLRGFRNLDLNVLFNVHLKSSEDSDTGRVQHKPSIQGSVGDEIAAYVDESLLLVARPMTDPQTGERIIERHLQTYPDPQHDWIKDHSFALPQELPLNFVDDYERIAKLIFDAAPPTPPKTPAPAPAPPPVSAPAPAASSAPTPPPRSTKAKTEGSTTPPAPEPTAPSPPGASAPAKVAAAGEQGTAGTGASVVPCTDCNTPIDDETWAKFSIERWQVPVCRACFGERKKKTKKTPAAAS